MNKTCPIPAMGEEPEAEGGGCFEVGVDLKT